MGCQLRFGTAGATGGGWSSRPGALQPTYEEPHAQPCWSWQARSPKTWKDKARFVSLWSFGCRVGYGMPAGNNGATTIGRNEVAADLFEPYSCDGEGTQSAKFIKGLCVDASGNPSASALVAAYRTSDNAFSGSVTAHGEDGSYAVPTQFPGVNHYVVAYKAGSPDIAGTSVNTLVPANLDGT